MTARSAELTEALSATIAKQPFFASILYDLLTIKEDPKVPTAATDGATIWVGDWFRKLPMAQRMFVICHEVGHVIFRHLPRAKAYRERGFGPDLKPWDDRKFNVAADYYINAMLDRDKIGHMPPIGLLDHNICSSADDLVDDIYCKLPDDDQDSMDEHRPAPDGAQAPTEEEIKQAVAGALQAAQTRGMMPGNMARAVGEILEPKQPWKQLLADYITSTVGRDDVSWTRPHRRKLALPPNMVFPGTQGHAMGTMVVAVDTSGSISPAMLQAFTTEMAGIIEQVRPRELWACWWDTKAVMARIEGIEDLVEQEAYGGGGTDYNCVQPGIEDEFVDPEIVVCLTDGYVSWPDGMPWNHLTVTTGADCPFGRNIKMDIGKDII